MKKIKILILALSLFVSNSVFAVGFDYGLEFGISPSSFKIKGEKSAIDNNLGWGVGTFLKADFGLFSVGPELWYTRNNADLDSAYFGADGSLKSHSLDLPVVVGYTFLKVLTFEVGPSFSLYNNTKVEFGGVESGIGSIKPSVGYVLGTKVTMFKILTIGARINGCFVRTDTDLGSMATNTYMISVGAKF